jgi:hypothetical protein
MPSTDDPLNDFVLKYENADTARDEAITIGSANPVPANTYATHAQKPPRGSAPPIIFTINSTVVFSEYLHLRHLIFIEG